jgi:hypothetical protein
MEEKVKAAAAAAMSEWSERKMLEKRMGGTMRTSRSATLQAPPPVLAQISVG